MYIIQLKLVNIKHYHQGMIRPMCNDDEKAQASITNEMVMVFGKYKNKKRYLHKKDCI